MSDRDEGYCYWMGEPINAMTREAAIEALGKAIIRIEELKFKLDLHRLNEGNIIANGIRDFINENFNRFTNESYLNSFC